MGNAFDPPQNTMVYCKELQPQDTHIQGGGNLYKFMALNLPALLHILTGSMTIPLWVCDFTLKGFSTNASTNNRFQLSKGINSGIVEQAKLIRATMVAMENRKKCGTHFLKSLQ